MRVPLPLRSLSTKAVAWMGRTIMVGAAMVVVVSVVSFIVPLAPRTRVVPLPKMERTAATATYAAPDTYGGTNPIETCITCDFWGKSDPGVETTPVTDPAEMVNPATGDLSDSYTLFSTPEAGGGSFAFTLSYDSLYAQNYTFEQNLAKQQNSNYVIYPGPFGWGWVSNENADVVNFNSNGYTAVTEPDSAVVDFNQNGSSTNCSAFTGMSDKTLANSVQQYCVADRVDASFGAFSNYGSYELSEQGGLENYTFNYYGQITSQGDTHSTTVINYLYNQSPSENGCPQGSGFTCTTAGDSSGRALCMPIQDRSARRSKFGALGQCLKLA